MSMTESLYTMLTVGVYDYSINHNIPFVIGETPPTFCLFCAISFSPKKAKKLLPNGT